MIRFERKIVSTITPGNETACKGLGTLSACKKAFSLKQFVLCGRLDQVMAELVVPDNDTEKEESWCSSITPLLIQPKNRI
jgi:hypothetical protein